MTEYSKDFKDVLITYPPENVEDNLSAILSNMGLKQFHTSETTKYAHVTFFFNGGIEKAYKGEDRKLVDSVNVKDFSDFPNMRAYEITEEVVKAIKSKKYDFILVNLSNPDMIGHTGNLNAAIEAIKAIDECAYQIAEETLKVGGDCIITADHGNCEEMVDKDGNILTQHTTNPVPLWLVSNNYKDVKLKTGKLANVAPTVLKLLNKEIPNNMEEALF
jgi:2,3-bisphosphoglycerate-independent phosphoglycerate mutase